VNWRLDQTSATDCCDRERCRCPALINTRETQPSPFTIPPASPHSLDIHRAAGDTAARHNGGQCAIHN